VPEEDVATDVHAGFIGSRSSEVHELAIRSEILLFDATGSFRIPLNPTAALVWSCLDGRATLAEISTDLAEGLDTPYETVLTHVLAVVADLVARGVVGGPAADPLSNARPLGRAAGTPTTPEPLLTTGARVGGASVVLESNDKELFGLLRAAIIGDSTAAPEDAPRVTLLTTPARGRISGATYLYRDAELIFRTTSRGRALRMTLALLASYAESSDDYVRLDAHVLVTDETAVLVGGWMREMIDTSWPRLGKLGYHVAETVFATVDRTSFEAVIELDRDGFDPGGIAAIEEVFPRTTEEHAVSGRFPITTIVVAGSEPDAAKLASPAQRLAGALTLLTGVHAQIQVEDVRWLGQLLDEIEPCWVHGFNDQELLEFLGQVTGRGSRNPAPMQ
jgi:hypothetical protein